MAIQTIQNGWSEIEPYLVPAIATVGTTFIVNKVWGNVAALFFAASTLGFTLSFPSIVKVLSSDDLLVGVVRVVISVALLFFGPQGVILSGTISLGLFLLRDVGLYKVREQLDEATNKLLNLKKNAEKRDTGRTKLQEDCKELNKSLELIPQPNGALSDAIQALEQKVSETADFLAKVITGAHLEEREQLARRIIDQLGQLNTGALK